MYSIGRNDCAGYIAQKLNLVFQNRQMSQSEIFAGGLICEIIKNIPKIEKKYKIEAFIFNSSAIQKGDILFCSFRKSRIAHHLGIYLGNNQIDHALPGKLAGQDFFRKSLFIFAVRLKKWD